MINDEVWLYTLRQDFGSLLLRDALYLLELSAGCVSNRLDSIISRIDDQLKISLSETCNTL